jgi:hypothetical protein
MLLYFRLDIYVPYIPYPNFWCHLTIKLLVASFKYIVYGPVGKKFTLFLHVFIYLNNYSFITLRHFYFPDEAG